MNRQRREFLSGFGKISVVAGTAAVVASAASKSRDFAEQSVAGVEKTLQSLGKRVDKLEHRQKNLTRALVVVTAVSTGLDLSLIL